MTTPTCFCGSPARLRQSAHGPFWGCSNWPECDGVVGCHPGTNTPLGTLADKATRQARRKAHEAFDALWLPMEKERQTYRSAAYVWLADQFDEGEIHIGEMTREEAERVVEMCDGMDPAEIAEWAMEGR